MLNSLVRESEILGLVCLGRKLLKPSGPVAELVLSEAVTLKTSFSFSKKGSSLASVRYAKSGSWGELSSAGVLHWLAKY